MKNQLILQSIFIAILFGLSTVVNANTIIVDTLDDSGTTSDGLCSLREAVSAASNDMAVDICGAGDVTLDVINFDPAIVPGDGSLFRIDLQNRITISGGNLQIIGLTSDRLELNGMQNYNIFRVSMDDGVELLISNLRLKDAQVSGAGGAIYINSGVSKVSLDDVELIDNASTGEGGAISTGVSKDLQLIISNSTFSGNSAPRGGAVSFTSRLSSGAHIGLDITQTKMTNNSAISGAGGAIFALPFDPSNFIDISISDSLFEMNTASDTGGAISAAGQASSDSMSVNLSRNLFYKNFSNGSSGGAFRSVNLDVTMVNNTFIENQAESSGGAILTTNTGGDRQTAIIANTFYQNTGGTGSAFTVAKEISVKFTDTPASINVFEANLISTDLNNQTDFACVFNNATALTTVGFNAVNDGTCVLDASDVNQSNLRLRLESGPTDIYPITVRLLPNSVAIDHWSDGQCLVNSVALQTDMTGLRRNSTTGNAFDGDADGNFDCDAGAFESPEAERLDITISGSGSVYENNFDINCSANCTMPVPTGVDVLLVALPDASNAFDSWTDACSSILNIPCGLNISAQTTAGAVFTSGVTTSVLNVSTTGDGLITSDIMGIYCGNTCRGVFEVGTMVTLTATPQQGSIFSGWAGDCSGTGQCVVTIDDMVVQSVQATFINQNYMLDVNIIGTGTGTVNSTQAGINCSPDCSQSYPAGTMVELTATPNGTDVFAGFSGDCTGTGSCQLNMNQNYSVDAEFQSIKTLSVSISGSGQVTSTTPVGLDCPGTCTLQANQFTSFTLQATETTAGQFFVGWQGDCSPTGDGTTCNGSFITNRNVTARFAGDDMFADGFE